MVKRQKELKVKEEKKAEDPTDLKCSACPGGAVILAVAIVAFLAGGLFFGGTGGSGQGECNCENLPCNCDEYCASQITETPVSEEDNGLETPEETPDSETEEAFPPIDMEKLRQQKVDIIWAYQCGPTLCFQIKADYGNTMGIPTRVLAYSINGEDKPVLAWSGGVNGNSCTSLIQIAPGRNCFGKLSEVSCLIGDVLNVSFEGGPEFNKEISGCR